MALEDILTDRRRKLSAIRELGLDAYPPTTRRNFLISEVLKNFKTFVSSSRKIHLAGRIRGLRNQGKITFLDLEDKTSRLQLVLKLDELDPISKKLLPLLDIGDFISAAGSAFTTNRGVNSLLVKKVTILTKSLRPLPGEYYGLSDIETRLRQRYLDMLTHPEVKEIFIRKSHFWQSVRSFLKSADFIEVETPVLELTPGGAEAEPFITHHNALDEDFYLRISLEIALKKVMVADFEKIFEIGRVFRNEGIDAEHLQDYTALEFYWAYADYYDLMKFVEKMYKTIIKNTFGSLKLKHASTTIDWSKKWPIIDYYQIFQKHTGLNLNSASTEDLFNKANMLGLKPDQTLGRGRLIDLLFKKTARPTLIKPCFLIDPPVDIEPLAKRHRDDPNRVERFQVVAYGSELGKGFSEANDPLDQRARFEKQAQLRDQGDLEAMRLDEEFLTALEHGLPPTAGFGFSERLFSVLEGKPIRETVIFPLMKRH